MLSTLRSVFVFILVLGFCTAGYWYLESIVPAAREVFWYVGLIAAALFFLIVQPHDTLSNMKIPYVFWIAFYLVTLIIAFMLSPRSEAVVIILIALLKGLTGFVCMILLITDKKSQKAALWAMVCVVLHGTYNNIYEFIDASTVWSAVPGRSAGWHFNPNRSGKILVMAFIFGSMVVSRKFFWPFVIVATIGVLLTFSRSSWVMLFVAVAGVSLFRSAPADKPLNLLNFSATGFVMMLIGTILAAGFIGLIFSGEAYKMVRGTQFETYLGADTTHRLSGGTDDGSTDERKHVLVEGIKVGLENPLFGAGLGATMLWEHRVPPHNEYVLFFGERGTLGLVVYLGLYIMVWLYGGRYGRLFVLVLAFASIASHNHLDSPAIYIFLVLALILKDKDYALQREQLPNQGRLA